MDQDIKQSNQDTLAPKDVPNYLKRLKATYSNDKVGQTFVTSSKRPQPDTDNTSQEKISPLMEKTIQDVMKDYQVTREQAIQIISKLL